MPCRTYSKLAFVRIGDFLFLARGWNTLVGQEWLFRLATFWGPKLGPNGQPQDPKYMVFKRLRKNHVQQMPFVKANVYMSASRSGGLTLATLKDEEGLNIGQPKIPTAYSSLYVGNRVAKVET